MERLLEQVAFEADGTSRVIEINASYVEEKLGAVAQSENLSQFIL